MRPNLTAARWPPPVDVSQARNHRPSHNDDKKCTSHHQQPRGALEGQRRPLNAGSLLPSMSQRRPIPPLFAKLQPGPLLDSASVCFAIPAEPLPGSQSSARRPGRSAQAFSNCQKKNDQIASTLSFSTSRRRRSIRIQGLGTDVSFGIYVFQAMVNYDMAECLAKEGCHNKRFLCCVDPHSADTILYLRTIQGDTGGKHINLTLQDNVFVTERLRRAHLPRWKFPRYALDHSIRIDSGWRQRRETCGVLYGRESNVHRSSP